MLDITTVYGDTDRIFAVAMNNVLQPVTGAIIKLTILNLDTNEYFDGSVFTPVVSSVLMSETNSSVLPGVYHYDFTAPEEFLHIAYTAEVVLGPTIFNFPQVGTVVFSNANFISYVTDIIASIEEIKDLDSTFEDINNISSSIMEFNNPVSTLEEIEDITISLKEYEDIIVTIGEI